MDGQDQQQGRDVGAQAAGHEVPACATFFIRQHGDGIASETTSGSLLPGTAYTKTITSVQEQVLYRSDIVIVVEETRHTVTHALQAYDDGEGRCLIADL
jgi:hypothetical protein